VYSLLRSQGAETVLSAPAPDEIGFFLAKAGVVEYPGGTRWRSEEAEPVKKSRIPGRVSGSTDRWCKTFTKG
jgi:hypothetical protein